MWVGRDERIGHFSANLFRAAIKFNGFMIFKMERSKEQIQSMDQLVDGLFFSSHFKGNAFLFSFIFSPLFSSPLIWYSFTVFSFRFHSNFQPLLTRFQPLSKAPSSEQMKSASLVASCLVERKRKHSIGEKLYCVLPGLVAILSFAFMLLSSNEQRETRLDLNSSHWVNRSWKELPSCLVEKGERKRVRLENLHQNQWASSITGKLKSFRAESSRVNST